MTYPHPSLEPILERTLGVVLFQEQILRITMVAAGFSGGEAEALRRAMGSKRSVEQMRAMEDKLRRGMARRGMSEEAREQIVHAIRSFALYGFPESHAASFALIAYASAYLKYHHPTAFTLALLNAWPMGFYHPSTLVQDAQRHGVEVRPIDVRSSGWRCRWEERAAADDAARPWASLRNPPAGAIRLGMRFLRGVRREAAAAIEREQAAGPFRDVDDLAPSPNRIVDSYGNLESYRDEGVAISYLNMADQPGKRASRTRFRTAYQRGQRFRFEFQRQGLTDPGTRYIIYKDQEGVRTWWDVKRQLRRNTDIWSALAYATGVSTLASATVPSLLFYNDPSDTESSPWITRCKNLKRLGDDYLDDHYMLRISGDFNEEEAIVWVDPETFLIGRVELRERTSGRDFRESRLEYVFQANEALGGDDFQFSETGVSVGH